MKWLTVVVVALIVGTPVFAVVGAAIMVVSAFSGQSGQGQGGACGPVVNVADDLGSSMTFTSDTGEQLTLDQTRLDNAAALLAGGMTAGADKRELLILFMTAFVESKFAMYANSTVPESLELPHDMVGSDTDSVGLLQQRPSAGWGDVAELMDPEYSAAAFLGGPEGPNKGSPAGLRDLPGVVDMTPGDAAQEIQSSAHPDAYDNWQKSAEDLLTSLGSAVTVGEGSCPKTASGDGAYPLDLEVPAPITDGVGPRVSPTAGASSWHPALDFGVACGVPVLAARPGTVTSTDGIAVVVTSDDGAAQHYLHMFASDVIVSVGDVVQAGQQIGAVGNAPPSTGCHLDLRVMGEGATDPAVQSLQPLSAQGGPPGWVDPAEYMRLYGVELIPA